MSKQCIHPLCTRVALMTLPSWLNINPFFERLGIPVGEDDEEGDDVCFGLAFASGLSAFIREFSTIFES